MSGEENDNPLIANKAPGEAEGEEGLFSSTSQEG